MSRHVEYPSPVACDRKCRSNPLQFARHRDIAQASNDRALADAGRVVAALSGIAFDQQHL
jgi:hypothetical protein